MPDSGPEKERKGAVGDMTSQRCEGCGEMYSQDSAIKHRDCNYSLANFQVSPPAPAQESDRTIVYSESNVEKSNPSDINQTKRKAGDPNWPEEVRTAAREPKNLLNQYILVAQIGKGGMGTVWKAFDRSLLRWVAIKFLTSADGNEEGVLRFKREAQLAGGLRHPNIAPIYEVGEARGQHFIAMEFIDGASMANAQLPIKDMIDIFIKVAQGIEAAHKKGVIHRDLKPQNIMLTSDNWPYVMDFGLAKALRGDSSLSVTGAVMGTPAYMPPEQAQGKLDLIDHQSDVYSLGATMYAILSRKTPFQAETAMDILMKVCNEEPVPPRKHNQEIPADVETIILKAMQKKKEDRYGSAQDLADDLKRYVAHEEIQATRPGFLTHVMRRAKRNKSAAIAVLVVLLAVAGVGAFILKNVGKNQGVGGGGGASPEDPSVKARQEWMNSWVEKRRKLTFEDWPEAEGNKLAEEANAHLKARGAIEGWNSADVDSQITSWYDSQIREARRQILDLYRDRSRWTAERARADRNTKWCDVANVVAGGIPELAESAKDLPDLRNKAAEPAGYKGNFILKIDVGPYAEITEITQDGKPITLTDDQKFSPGARFFDLLVAEYRITLKHPDYERVVVDLKGVEAGKTYLISGVMKDRSTVKPIVQ